MTTRPLFVSNIFTFHFPLQFSDVDLIALCFDYIHIYQSEYIRGVTTTKKLNFCYCFCLHFLLLVISIFLLFVSFMISSSHSKSPFSFVLNWKQQSNFPRKLPKNERFLFSIDLNNMIYWLVFGRLLFYSNRRRLTKSPIYLSKINFAVYIDGLYSFEEEILFKNSNWTRKSHEKKQNWKIDIKMNRWSSEINTNI